MDGTVITGDLNLFDKWSEGRTGGATVSFAYTDNSEGKSALIPNGIIWRANTRICPDDLPALPTPTAQIITITGWYLNPQGMTLIDAAGALVGVCI